VLTGNAVRVGNFSYVSPAALERLVVVSELWNHYAAGVTKARLPYALVPTSRGTRIAGESRMNVAALVVHGLSAISVFGDVVGVRLLGATVLVMGAALAASAVALFRGGMVAGWFPSAALVLVLVTSQTLVLALFLAFVVLSARQSLSFVPIRDYELFISGVEASPPLPASGGAAPGARGSPVAR
jgi:hypothetical protein